MRAFIPQPSGIYAIADYDRRRQMWRIDHGFDDVPLPPGESAMAALRKAHPAAQEPKLGEFPDGYWAGSNL
jgi:hypothetical protein